MAREQYTDDQLSDLTDDEREALQSDDGGEGEDEGDAQASGQDEGQDTGKQDESGQDAGKQDDAGEGADTTGQDGGQETGQQGDDSAPDQQQDERFRSPLLSPGDEEKAKQELESIAPKKDEILQKFDDGELTPREYHQQLDELNREERKLEFAIEKSNMAREMAVNQAREDWINTANKFIQENPHYEPGTSLYKALNQTVIEIAKDPQNENMTGRQILEKADEQVRSDLEKLGLSSPNKQNKRQESTDDAGGDKDKGLPPNLGRMPAASGTEVENTRFAALDKLQETDPERYEEEVANLSESDREAYLSTM